MAEDLLDYWIRIFRPLFPVNAWMVGRISGEDHVIQIDWRLESDPRLPRKRSRKIEIIIPAEAIGCYLDKTKAEQASAEARMKNWISEHYVNFDPEHDARSSRAVYAEKWRFSAAVLS